MALPITVGSIPVPPIGLGVFALDDEATATIVSTSIELGYRLIDTASIYGNERGVGEGIRRSGIDRGELIITTKLWTDAHAEDLAVGAARDSLDRLGLDYVDLYLIHWPDSRQGRYLAAWEGLQRVQQLGLAREIGVSNFSIAQLDELVAGGTAPAINQIELHPYHSRVEDKAAHDHRDIVTEAWSPLARGRVFDDEVIQRIADEVDATAAQVVLRWHVARGLIAIAKASSRARLAENLASADVVLSPAQLSAIDAMNRNELVEPDYYQLS